MAGFNDELRQIRELDGVDHNLSNGENAASDGTGDVDESNNENGNGNYSAA